MDRGGRALYKSNARTTYIDIESEVIERYRDFFDTIRVHKIFLNFLKSTDIIFHLLR